jgi:hypothetical protein
MRAVSSMTSALKVYCTTMDIYVSFLFFLFFLPRLVPDRKNSILLPVITCQKSTRQRLNPNRLGPVLPITTRQAHLYPKKIRLITIKSSQNDARPVGARRPRYAASGEVACAGEGEGGSELEPVEELMEMSGGEA